MPGSPPDALVMGEALVDVIRRPDEPDDPRVGGSPFNVAVGLSRLEIPVDLYTRIGVDPHGEMLARHLVANGVGLVEGSLTSERTSTAVARIGPDGAATYDFDVTWSLSRVPRRSPALVHTGSIGAVVEPGASVVSEALGALREDATVSYDPNVRPRFMAERGAACARVEELVALADVVKASDEDAAWLYPGVAVEDVARDWLQRGPAVVVMTRGGTGAHAATADAAVDLPAPSAAVVDTIGAGDSFMAGLLAALADAALLGRSRETQLRALDVDTLSRLVEFAAACAAVTVSRPGADPPCRAELRAGVGLS